MAFENVTTITAPFYPNGVTTDFPFSFKGASASEVVALEADGTIIDTALYTVTLNSDEGGTLAFSDAPEADDYPVLFVASNPSFAQPDNFDNAGPSFNPASLTRALDRAAVRDLFLKGLSDRAPKVPHGESGPTMEAAAARANKFAKFDAQGNLTGVTAADLAELLQTVEAGTTVSEFIDRFLFEDDSSGDNVIINADVNQIADGLHGSTILGGGNSNSPNLIGFVDYYDQIVGDGSNNVFTSTFDVTDTDLVGVFLIRADGVRVQVEEVDNIDVSIVGGKAQVTYPTSGNTHNAAGGEQGSDPKVLATESIVIIYRVATVNPSSGCDFSTIVATYDGRIEEGIAQQIVCSPHGRITGGDHNFVAGGSYLRKEGGSYGALVSGTGVVYSASGSGGGTLGTTLSTFTGIGPQWGLGVGLNFSDAAFSGAGGVNITMSGNGSWAFGREHNVNAQDVFVGGNDQTVSAAYGTAFGLSNTTSGAYGFAVGRENTASGESSHAGGRESTASSTYTFTHGYQNNVSGTASAAVGYQNTVSGPYGFAGGRQHTVSGAYNGVFGRLHTVTADWALTTGYNAKNPHDFSHCIGGEAFSSTGDCQATRLVLRAQTTDASPTEALSGAAAARVPIPDQTTWFFTAKVVARRTDADDESAAYKLEGCIDRNTGAATTALAGSVTKTVVAEDNVAWDVAAAADTTNGALSITVTGEASKTIRWVVEVSLVEVTG